VSKLGGHHKVSPAHGMMGLFLYKHRQEVRQVETALLFSSIFKIFFKYIPLPVIFFLFN
jgi:hypothetical protein